MSYFELTPAEALKASIKTASAINNKYTDEKNRLSPTISRYYNALFDCKLLHSSN